MIIWTRFRWACSRNGLTVFVVGRSHSRNWSSRSNKLSSSLAVPPPPHIPVMPHRVCDFVEPDKCELIVDMTFGAGGHTRHLLRRSQKAKVVCVDRDPVAYEYALQLRDEYPTRVVPLLGKFSDVDALLRQHGYGIGGGGRCVDAILFDLGPSSMQFDDAQRGFASSKDGPLDMRMDSNPDSMTAADVLAYAHELDLQRIFKVYGDESHAKKIARAIVETRQSFGPLRRTHQLRELVASVLGERLRVDKLGRFAHPSTKVFQALRVFVNDELNQLEYGLRLAGHYLKVGGVLVALTFHSLEDTLLKRHLSGRDNGADDPVNRHRPLPLSLYSFNAGHHDRDALNAVQPAASWKPLTKHVCVPTAYEMSVNPRSRSAKLRAGVKIA